MTCLLGDLIKLFQTVGIVKKIDYMWHRHGNKIYFLLCLRIRIVVQEIYISTSQRVHFNVSVLYIVFYSYFVYFFKGPQRGLPKGFAFIEMGDLSSAAAAIKSLNGLVVTATTVNIYASIHLDNIS